MTPARTCAAHIRDELKYTYRLELVQDPALETLTFRNRGSETGCRCDAWARSCGQFRRRARQSLGGLHWRICRPTISAAPLVNRLRR